MTRAIILALALLQSSSTPRELTALADHHQHLFSPAIAKRTSREPVDAARLVELLDEAGIRHAVILSMGYHYGSPNRPQVANEYEAVKAENDWTSEQVARFPDRLRAFCGVNPLREYALEELARCAKDPRLRAGLKLHFGNSDVDLGNAQHVARLREIFAAANRHGMAIVVHARSSISLKRPYGAAYARAFLDELLPAAPDVPVQIAHLAGAGSLDDPLVAEALDVFGAAAAKRDPRMTRVYFDVSGIGELKRHGPRMASRIRELGIERILYGSDGGGSPAPKDIWVAFRQLPLFEEEFRTIAANTAPYLR